MRSSAPLFVFAVFAALAACSQGPSNGDAGPDAGADAPSDVTPPSDAPADAPPGDGNTCNIQASATINGTFLGQTLSPKDAIAFQTHPSQYEVVVGVTDYAGACGFGNDVKASSNVFAIIYQSNTPLVPATIDLSNTNVLFVQYTQFDATCNSPQGESASSGTVTFSTVDACGVTGSFDVTLNSDHVTGTFSAPTCADTPDGGASACK
jgi:hypothetical protein